MYGYVSHLSAPDIIIAWSTLGVLHTLQTFVPLANIIYKDVIIASTANTRGRVLAPPNFIVYIYFSLFPLFYSIPNARFINQKMYKIKQNFPDERNHFF